MSGLQETFYIMGIVYMSIMLILTIIIIGAVITIKSRIDAIHQRIEERLHTISEVAEYGEKIVNKAKDMMQHHREKNAK